MSTEVPVTNNPLTEKKPNLWQRFQARRNSLNENTVARAQEPKIEPRAEEAKAEQARLATTANAVANKTSFAQAANNTNENLEETQKVLGQDPHAEVSKVEEAIKEQKELNKTEPQPQPTSQLEQVGISQEQIPELKAQVEEMGVDENTDPEQAKDKLANTLIENGLIKLREDGSYEAVPYDSKWSSILRGIGTALSIVLGIASGGALPPINFYNIRSDNDKEKKEAHEKLLTNAVDTLNGIITTEAEGNYYNAGGQENAEAQGKYSVATTGGERQFEQQKEIININFDNAKEMADFQNELTKNLVKYNAEVDAGRLVREIKSLKESGMKPDEIAKWVQREHGQTAANAAADTIGKYTNMAAQAVGTAVGAATGLGSDKRFKDFKRTGYKKHERIK